MTCVSGWLTLVMEDDGIGTIEKGEGLAVMSLLHVCMWGVKEGKDVMKGRIGWAMGRT